ncbi:MAG: hypothetical protein SPG69_03325, partial [Bacteroides pyogenes]|uniref:hypothetical protein n=1 Tax=Bacteroides pyogenes TaxID=310300 RepID=UPI002A90A314
DYIYSPMLTIYIHWAGYIHRAGECFQPHPGSLLPDDDFMNTLEECIDYCGSKRVKFRLKGKSPVQCRTLFKIV